MARHARLSPRTFARRFQQETGTAPLTSNSSRSPVASGAGERRDRLEVLVEVDGLLRGVRAARTRRRAREAGVTWSSSDRTSMCESSGREARRGRPGVRRRGSRGSRR
ncbi:hypothetical protein [Streptomyces sp. NL15-2K]|uniref:hypothetical protein n=1 Tax=Streptomyces sp. NL15-2K TaxID=376149 RepID=UPI0035B50A91